VKSIRIIPPAKNRNYVPRKGLTKDGHDNSITTPRNGTIFFAVGIYAVSR